MCGLPLECAWFIIEKAGPSFPTGQQLPITPPVRMEHHAQLPDSVNFPQSCASTKRSVMKSYSLFCSAVAAMTWSWGALLRWLVDAVSLSCSCKSPWVHSQLCYWYAAWHPLQPSFPQQLASLIQERTIFPLQTAVIIITSYFYLRSLLTVL